MYEGGGAREAPSLDRVKEFIIKKQMLHHIHGLIKDFIKETITEFILREQLLYLNLPRTKKCVRGPVTSEIYSNQSEIFSYDNK